MVFLQLIKKSKMKNFILVMVVMFAFGYANAQEAKFGVMSGVDFATAKVTVSGNSVSQSETGFYVGTFVDIAASEKFHIQPELVLVLILVELMISIKISASKRNTI